MLTDFGGIGTADMERTAGRCIDGARGFAGQHGLFPGNRGIRHRDGIHQRLGVRMQGIGKQLLGFRVKPPAETYSSSAYPLGF